MSRRASCVQWADGMRWADGFIAVDWGTTNRRAYRIDSSGACVDEFEDGKGALSVPDGEFPAAVAEIRDAARRPAAAARRNGRLQPRLGRRALCAVPGGDRRSRRRTWSGPASAKRSFPACRTIGEGRADVMRGEEVQLLGARRRGPGRPDALGLPPGHAQQMGRGAPAAGSRASAR